MVSSMQSKFRGSNLSSSTPANCSDEVVILDAIFFTTDRTFVRSYNINIIILTAENTI